MPDHLGGYVRQRLRVYTQRCKLIPGASQSIRAGFLLHPELCCPGDISLCCHNLRQMFHIGVDSQSVVRLPGEDQNLFTEAPCCW